MSVRRPTRIYQNHHLDSTRWAAYTARPGDVVVCNAYKSGSTWTQQIIRLLMGASTDDVFALRALSIWPEVRHRNGTIDDLKAQLDAAPDRRIIKSHMPLDGMPFFDEARHVYVGRDPRDVFMSIHNHYSSFTDVAYRTFNDTPGRVGEPLPRCPDDIRVFWKQWISRGWFPWESEGYPFWSNLHHVATFWPLRDAANVLFVHYGDMLADLPAEIRRMADFLEIEVSDERIAEVAELMTFRNVRATVDKNIAEHGNQGPGMLKNGLASFFNKGTNGRWRDVLTEADLTLYTAAKDRVLDPECAAWLERGRAAL